MFVFFGDDKNKWILKTKFIEDHQKDYGYKPIENRLDSSIRNLRPHTHLKVWNVQRYWL